jgi:hypothetical protein
MAVVQFHELPLADRDREWDGSTANRRVRAWADAEDEPNDAISREARLRVMPNRTPIRLKAQCGRGARSMTPAEAAAALSRGELQLVDVREAVGGGMLAWSRAGLRLAPSAGNADGG